MIFDRIEWDEHNLRPRDHEAHRRRDRAGDLNANRMVPHREHADRGLFRSVTDGGKSVVVIVEILHNGVRPITGWEA